MEKTEMNVVVTNHRPTIPAWAWLSAVVAFLLFFGVVWWASTLMEPQGTINTRPTIPDNQPLQTTENLPPLTNGFVQEPDSASSQLQSPQGYIPPAPADTAAVQKPKKIRIVVGEPAGARVIPPPVRIH